MSAPGRNDPCPCGSGRKYKHCCLLRQREDERRDSIPNGATAAALDFLYRRYGDQADGALAAGFFGTLDEEGKEELRRLPENLETAVEINSKEWLLADGALQVGGTLRPAMDLVLAEAGPRLDIEARTWLAEMAKERLGIYEVVEVWPGKGLSLRNALRPRAKTFEVRERVGSGQLVAWDLVGARVVPWESGYVLSGAIYTLDRLGLESLRRALGAERGGAKRRSARDDGAVGRLLVAQWLHRLTHRRIPKLVDAGSGDPILLVTDHYDVSDWSALETRLAGQPDVEGARGSGWSRLAPGRGALRSTLLSLNVKPPDRLEAFARTLRRADEGRLWLREVAGETIRFRVREQADPAAALREGRPRPAAPSAPEIDPATATELRRTLIAEVYRDWPDQAVPALGGRTPREALGTREGRRQVIDLLKLYEVGEARASREEGRQPVSFAWLWQELGLDRERVLR